jgi:hypothetical protein
MPEKSEKLRRQTANTQLHSFSFCSPLLASENLRAELVKQRVMGSPKIHLT